MTSNSMIIIYKLTDDKSNLIQIQSIIKNGLSGYRTKWGLYGSSDWFEKIRTENLIETIEGVVSSIYFSGHNDFQMFSVYDGNITVDFELIGKEQYYKIGKKINIECIRNKYVRPTSGLEKLLIPLKIEIEK